MSEAYRRVAQQPGKEDVKGSARAHDSLVHACVVWLKLHGIEAAAINQKPHRRKDGTWHTPGAPRGFGDIVACIPPFGRMWVIECKTGKSRVRPEQVEAAGEWTRAGALWDIVRSVDELPAKLEIRGAVFDGLGRPTFR